MNEKNGAGPKKSRPWHINNFFRSIDKFARDVPAFNIKGESKVKTILGGASTFTLLVIIVMYAATKFIALSNREGLVMRENIIERNFN